MFLTCSVLVLWSLLWVNNVSLHYSRQRDKLLLMKDKLFWSVNLFHRKSQDNYFQVKHRDFKWFQEQRDRLFLLMSYHGVNLQEKTSVQNVAYKVFLEMRHWRHQRVLSSLSLSFLDVYFVPRKLFFFPSSIRLIDNSNRHRFNFNQLNTFIAVMLYTKKISQHHFFMIQNNSRTNRFADSCLLSFPGFVRLLVFVSV